MYYVFTIIDGEIVPYSTFNFWEAYKEHKKQTKLGRYTKFLVKEIPEQKKIIDVVHDSGIY